MSEAASNDVFISYRREEGGLLALALYQEVVKHGVDAFYDIESIRAGHFDTLILRQIAARPYFLLVLTPGTLERCVDPGDWLRREIEQAVATERTVIPAYTPKFDFDEFDRYLPGELGQTVRRFNGLELPQKWFKYAVQQLVEEFLLPIDLGVAEVSGADRAAVDQIRSQIEEVPSVSQVQLTAQEFFERAYACPDDDLDSKIADYTEAIRLDPELAIAFNNRAIARRGKGDFDGAVADYSEAIRLNPQHADLLYSRGLVLGDKGDFDGAMVDHTEAIRLNPRHADAMYSRAIARRNKGDLDGAIADYTETIRINPQYANAFYNRALIRHDKGDLSGAIADLEEGMRHAPQDEDFPRVLAQYRREKGP